MTAPLSPLVCSTWYGKKDFMLGRGTVFGFVGHSHWGSVSNPAMGVWQGGRIALCAQLLARTKVLCGRAKFSRQQNCYCAQRAVALPCDKLQQPRVLQGGRGNSFDPVISRGKMAFVCLPDRCLWGHLNCTYPPETSASCVARQAFSPISKHSFERLSDSGGFVWFWGGFN